MVVECPQQSSFASAQTHVSISWLSVKMNVQKQSSLFKWTERSNVCCWNVWFWGVKDCERNLVRFAEEWDQAGYWQCFSTSPPPALASLQQGIGLEECRWLPFRSTKFSCNGGRGTHFARSLNSKFLKGLGKTSVEKKRFLSGIAGHRTMCKKIWASGKSYKNVAQQC